MTIEESISIANDFNNWLEDMAEKYKLDKDDIQELIRLFLMCTESEDKKGGEE